MMSKKALIGLLVIFFAAVAIAFGGEKNSDVVALVGKHKITREDLDTYLNKIPLPFRQAFSRNALNKLIETQVFYDMAKREGLEKSPEFLSRLERDKKRLLADFYIEKRLKQRVRVTSAEISAYYNSHKSLFKRKQRVKIADIRVQTPAKAREVKRRLQKGEPFEKVARHYARLPFIKNIPGGIWLERGRGPEAIEKVAFSLKKGQISDIVKAPNGYHIIKVLDREEAGTLPLGRVRGMIEKRLRREKVDELKRRLIQKAGVKILDKEFQQKSSSIPFMFPQGR